MGNNLKKTKHPKIMLCDEEIKKENLNYKLDLFIKAFNKKLRLKKVNNLLVILHNVLMTNILDFSIKNLSLKKNFI